jgi:hypothetical protein
MFDTLNFNKPFAGVLELETPVFSCDFSNQGHMAAVGCSDGLTRIYNIAKLG